MISYFVLTKNNCKSSNFRHIFRIISSCFKNHYNFHNKVAKHFKKTPCKVDFVYIILLVYSSFNLIQPLEALRNLLAPTLHTCVFYDTALKEKGYTGINVHFLVSRFKVPKIYLIIQDFFTWTSPLYKYSCHVLHKSIVILSELLSKNYPL